MSKLIKYLKNGLIYIGSILILSIVLSILNLIGLNNSVTSIISVIIMNMILFILGFIEGKKTEKKGFLAGFKIGIYYLIILFIIKLLFFKTSFNISIIPYYLILILSTTLGAMIGINKKKQN